MTLRHKDILIISDIEGSSGCQDYEMSSFMTNSWPKACLGMSRDVSAVVDALLKAGANSITVKDFHRTGYNIFPEYLNNKAKLVQGYKIGPVAGLGDPTPSTALVMIGMHAPSGSDGFLAHTLTSRIARLEVNGKLMSESQLFSASLAPFGIKPIFFSGCPEACDYTQQNLKGIRCFPIHKTDKKTPFSSDTWRQTLSGEVVKSLVNNDTSPYEPIGPFHANVTIRDGESVARSIGKKWKLQTEGATIILDCEDIHSLYTRLLQLCYLTPFVERILPIGIQLFNVRG
ncbi:MAG: hypothetical protein GY866_35270, partial [Proteobacteria bacterium]|nr:hypothetical protein [Pseudomonadota bacterium]